MITKTGIKQGAVLRKSHLMYLFFCFLFNYFLKSTPFLISPSCLWLNRQRHLLPRLCAICFSFVLLSFFRYFFLFLSLFFSFSSIFLRGSGERKERREVQVSHFSEKGNWNKEGNCKREDRLQLAKRKKGWIKIKIEKCRYNYHSQKWQEQMFDFKISKRMENLPKFGKTFGDGIERRMWYEKCAQKMKKE